MKEVFKLEKIRNKVCGRSKYPTRHNWNAMFRGAENEVTVAHLDKAIEVIRFESECAIAYLTQQKEKCKK